MKKFLVFFLALSLLFLGCLDGGIEEKTPSSTTLASEDLSLEELDVSFMLENDSVEIGDMI
ncbi:MAG: hypothetical protein JW778_02525 [Candidatus Altiarchaeota archaeon]|nr:hypothetical protein [Candidatus Altiarchaeota archaeon]